MSANEYEDMMVKFEKSAHFSNMRDELLNQFMQSDGPAAVNASVEKLIATDLESNPRLLDAFVSSSVDESISESRLTTIFERRVKSEVEAGMTGRPFDQFLAPREEELARRIADVVKKDQSENV